MALAAAVLAAVAGLGFLVAPRLSWATPFALPGVISYHGQTYYIDTNTWNGSRSCTATSRTAPRVIHVDRLPKSYTPLRRVGDVFGYFTASKPILLPHYESGYKTAYVLFVPDGSCLRTYLSPNSG